MVKKSEAAGLRSERWFKGTGIRQFAHRQRMQQQGLPREAFMGRPVIGIINTWSDLSPCHCHLRDRAQSVKQGVLQAGGFPCELPAMSLGEVMVKPTTMLYRNLLAVETEELLRSLPLDGVVLMGGCDKTTPGLMMGAFSMNIPSLFLPAGPMLNDKYCGVTVGAGTHTKRFYTEYRRGDINDAQWIELEQRMTRSPGTCNTMGTASTMTSIVEALGFTLPGATAIPAVDAAHSRMAWHCGQRIVEMVREDLRPSRIATRPAFHNAAKTYMALGGSTNAAIHLIAMAGRAGITLTLDDLDRFGREIPVLVDLLPTGKHLMEDFYYAGGLPVLLNRISQFLELDALTVTGQSLGENIKGCENAGTEVIRALNDPVRSGEREGSGGAKTARDETEVALAVLHGNLCPAGAVIKPLAAAGHLMRHRGPALVWDSVEAMKRAVDDETLDVNADTVFILRNAGPVGAPGMPEWGNLPIPKKLLKEGIQDVVRISDARMSGTHYGTCVVHVAPEAAVGGPLALVRTGDMVILDVAKRELTLEVSDAELQSRRLSWKPAPEVYKRGYVRMYKENVEQANAGCDWKELSGVDETPEPTID